MTLPRSVAAKVLCAFTPLAVAGCDAAPNGNPTGPTSLRPNLQLASASEFVTTGGAEITLIVDDFTERWSFVAKRDESLNARGEFNFIARVFGTTVHAQGNITCFEIDGNRARLGGVITHSNTPDLVGIDVIWTVEDNGEGTKAPAPDRATSLQFGEPEPHCLVAPVPDLTLLPIETGNVKVHS